MRYLKYLIIAFLLCLPTAYAIGVSYEDETSYTSMRGSFVDGQTWFDGEVLGSELADNPGFETAGGGGADIWDDWYEALGGDGVLTNEGVIVHGGADACKISGGATGENTRGELYVGSLTAGSMYRVSVYTRGDGTGNPRFQIRAGASGDFWNPSTQAWQVGVVNPTTGNTTTTYQEYTQYVTLPAGTQLRLRCYAPTTNNDVYFDDVSVKLVTSLSTQYADTANLLIADDGSGNKAYGFIGEAGTGETLGSDLFDANKGTFTEASLLLTEQIVNQVARDFSGASGWMNVSWNAYDETDDLTVTATAADQYCLLLNSEISNEQIGLHVLEVDVANLVSTVDVRFGATWATGIVLATITSNGADQKFYTYLDSVMGSGMIFVGANENDSSADLDNFSLKAIDISWTPYGTNTMEIDSDALKITYVDTVNGAYLYLKDSADLNDDLEIGKSYKLTFDAKRVNGNVDVRVNHSGADPGAEVTTTSFALYEIYFTATSTTGSYIKITNMNATEEIWLDNLVLTEVTEPNANAVHIYKERGLVNEGWFSIGSVDYNAGSSWDFDVHRTGRGVHSW